VKVEVLISNRLIDEYRKGASFGTKTILYHPCAIIDIACFILYMHLLDSESYYYPQ
jgi:hypothetical protein